MITLQPPLTTDRIHDIVAEQMRVHGIRLVFDDLESVVRELDRLQYTYRDTTESLHQLSASKTVFAFISEKASQKVAAKKLVLAA